MLYFFSGTDRKKAYAATDAAIRKSSKNGPHIVRITDANAPADLAAVLGGGGMFGEKHVIMLDGVCANGEMREVFFAAMPEMAKSKELFFVLEGKLDAPTRKGIEKYAEKAERFDVKKEKEGEKPKQKWWFIQGDKLGKNFFSHKRTCMYCGRVMLGACFCQSCGLRN